MGLRDKLRSKKSKDQAAAAPVAGAVPSMPPSAFGGGRSAPHMPVDPKAAAAPRMPADPKAAAAGQAFPRTTRALEEQRAATEREAQKQEAQKEVLDKIKEYKTQVEVEEKKLEGLNKKKRVVVGQLKEETSKKVKDDPKIARLKKQIRRFNNEIEDMNGRINRTEEAMNALKTRLEQKTDHERTTDATKILENIKVDADKMEDALYKAQEQVQETQEMRAMMNGISIGEMDPEPDELGDDIEKELALYDQQEEEEKAKLAVSASTDDAVARIEGVGATPTDAPGRVATSTAADDEEMMADLEKEMAM